MTVKEVLTSGDADAIAKVLCSLVEQTTELARIDLCDNCPACDFCYRGHNGFLSYLEQEVRP